jgi:hypothetical protein
MKPRPRQGVGKRLDNGNDDDSASEPADSIIDSGSESEEDNEVDGILGK